MNEGLTDVRVIFDPWCHSFEPLSKFDHRVVDVHLVGRFVGRCLTALADIVRPLLIILVISL
jgi:hypothetical protein